MFIMCCNSKVLWFFPQTEIDGYIAKLNETKNK